MGCSFTSRWVGIPLPLVLIVAFLIYGCEKHKQVETVPSTNTKNSANLIPANKPTTQEQAKIPTFVNRLPELRQARDEDWFEDVASQSGIEFAYRDGSEGGHYQLLESVGGGIASFDFDRDGWQDLFFTGGGQLGFETPIQIQGRPAGLFRNQSGWSFIEVSSIASLSSPNFYSHGCTAFDLNGDGFQDILVAGYRGLQLWLNNGDGTFEEQTQQRQLESVAWNVTAATGDYNSDGLPDLYVLTYADWEPDHTRRCLNDRQIRDICGPTIFPGARDVFFQNTGNGFVNITDKIGLVEENRGLGILAADWDEDQRIDFTVVNDVQANQLYLNESDGSFRESGLYTGIAFSNTGEREGSMGVDAGDFNGDGVLDLWYTNYTQQDNSLLRNMKKGGFVHSAGVMGLTGVSRQWVGFGTGFADFNCDGWDDLYVINGHVAYERRDSPYFQPPQLFRNDAGQKFTEVSLQAGAYFEHPRSGRGSVRTDLDNDGDYDLVVSHQNDPVAVLKNRHHPDHWVGIELVGLKSDRDAIGAKVTVNTSEREITRWKVGGGSYLSHNDSRLLFAIGEQEHVEATVQWLDGTVERFTELLPGRYHVLLQGAGLSNVE